MLTFEQLVEREWLQGRYLALELAALLDRLDAAAVRAGRDAFADPRMAHLAAAISQLATPGAHDRAERLLRLYSKPEHLPAGEEV